jgi:hypothetical protein
VGRAPGRRYWFFPCVEASGLSFAFPLCYLCGLLFKMYLCGLIGDN